MIIIIAFNGLEKEMRDDITENLRQSSLLWTVMITSSMAWFVHSFTSCFISEGIDNDISSVLWCTVLQSELCLVTCLIQTSFRHSTLFGFSSAPDVLVGLVLHVGDYSSLAWPGLVVTCLSFSPFMVMSAQVMIELFTLIFDSSVLTLILGL